MHWRVLVLCLAAASLAASSQPARAEPQPGTSGPAPGDGRGACENDPSIPGCKEVIAAVGVCDADPNLPCRTIDCEADPSQPACRGVDCSLPAAAGAPECATGPDCALPESAGLPECTDCADPGNAGRPECAATTVLDDPCTAEYPPPDWCKTGEDPCAGDAPPEWCTATTTPCDPAAQNCTVQPPFYWRDCSDTTRPCYMYYDAGGPLPVLGPRRGPPRPLSRRSPPAAPSRLQNPTCRCILLYAPVCGKDGKTYSNACFAGCAKVKPIGACRKRSPGACWLDCKAAKAGCKCDLRWAPTCGADGNVYSNACFAECKTSVQFPCGNLPWGACKRRCLGAQCVCPLIYAPVCGKDGRVYDNSCQAECLKQPVRWPCGSRKTCAKECRAAARPQGCVCPEIYAPVCTKSGQVAANQCFAQCNKQAVRWPCGSRRDCAKACKAAAGPSAGANTCACTKEYRPVCARSGALFGNSCMARCAKAKIRFPCGVMTRSSCQTACKKAAAGSWR